MCAAKCRRPCLYTRSKSACRSNRTLRGNRFGRPEPDTSAPLFGARALTILAPHLGYKTPQFSGKGETLLTEAGLHRHPLAALGAPPRNHRAAALGLHPRKKSVRLRAVTTVGLECALGHEKSLLLMNWISLNKANRSINEQPQAGKTEKTGQCRRANRRRTLLSAAFELGLDLYLRFLHLRKTTDQFCQRSSSQRRRTRECPPHTPSAPLARQL